MRLEEGGILGSLFNTVYGIGSPVREPNRSIKHPSTSHGHRKPLEQIKIHRNDILVIEDDRDLLIMMKKIKLDHNLPMYFCDSAAKAIRLATTRQFDAILLDWNLPDFTSQTLITCLDQIYADSFRRQGRALGNKIPVVCFSSQEHEIVQIQPSRYFEEVDFWQKPIRFNLLEDKIQNLVFSKIPTGKIESITRKQ